MQSETRKRIANLTSNVLNPFLVSLALIWLLSLASTPSPFDALKWTLLAMGLSVLPVFLVVLYLVRTERLDAIFTNVRGQRTQIFLLATACAVMGGVILALLKAPPVLVTAFIAGLATAVIFMCINLWWKISLHTAFVAGSATVLVMLYGWIAAVAVALVPLTVWARTELKHHSLAEATVGALLAALIALVVFSLVPF